MQTGDKVTYVPFVLRYAKDTELRAPSVVVPVVWVHPEAVLRWWNGAQGGIGIGNASRAEKRKSEVRAT